MQSGQFLCVILALSVGGCASWHQPSLVYRGRASQLQTVREESPATPQIANVVDNEVDSDESFLGDADTITPPIEGTAHRSKYRSSRTRVQHASERRTRESRPSNPPPERGYLELPPPPEMEDSGGVRLGHRIK